MLAEFLSRAECPKELQGMKENPRMKAFQNVLDFCIRSLQNYSIEAVLCMAKEKMEKSYKGSMFAYSWQKDMAVIMDTEKLKRAFVEIFSEGEKLVAVKQYASVSVPGMEEGFFVDHVVDMILQRPSGMYVAVNFHLGKGNRGPKCKSREGLPWCDPVTLVTKGGLEKKYPGILVWDVYLTHDKDTADYIYPEFDKSDLKTSQLKVSSYRQAPVNFYEESIWNEKKFLDFAREIFSEPGKPNCELCSNAYLCRNGIPRLEPNYDVVEEQEEVKCYQMPVFSEEQERIVRHKEGAFLVVAGPGSGKTATLVGRLNYLVSECDVPPEFILAITFTNKAAGEIKERCRSFLKEGEEVDCCTLNALGYRILLNHAKEIGVETYKLLTKDKKLELIDDLLHGLSKPLQGFKYEMKFGDTGFLNTVCRRLEAYSKEPEATMEKYHLGQDFVDFAGTYFNTIKTGGYIDYSEQISLCVKLLEEHKDILEIYQKMYWYVCVDEVQDIDLEQCKLIDMLSEGHKNLMMIGDDDQSIYEWRGASPSFMLNFQERYPDGQIYFLSKNFRCTENIVRMASENLTSGLVRFDKKIVAVKGPGAPVDLVEGNTYHEKTGDLLRKILSEGVRPDDIAVLSWNHKTLAEVYKNLPDLPLKMEGELLCRSAFFTFVKSALNLLADFSNEKARWEYFSVFGLPKPKQAECESKYLVCDAPFPYVEIGKEECAYLCLNAMGLSRNLSAKDFILYAAQISGYKNQPVKQQMLDELIRQRNVKTVTDLQETMNMMVDAEDDKKLDAVYPGKILLSTVHVAKGKEWKHVIVLDDFGDVESPAVRRLIYVALTRAEENLYIVKLSGKRSLLVPAA